jgi:uncharacterized protein (UPF0333 family)
MFKKHKFKILLVLVILIIAGGGTAYYFKKKEAAKKADATDTTTDQAKEPISSPKPVDTSTEKPTTAVTKDLVVLKDSKSIVKATK